MSYESGVEGYVVQGPESNRLAHVLPCPMRVGSRGTLFRGPRATDWSSTCITVPYESGAEGYVVPGSESNRLV